MNNKQNKDLNSTELKCPECKNKNVNFTSSNDLEKHQMTYHPKNDIERAWSKHAKENFRNYKGSSYYESFGPYY